MLVVYTVSLATVVYYLDCTLCRTLFDISTIKISLYFPRTSNKSIHFPLGGSKNGVCTLHCSFRHTLCKWALLVGRTQFALQLGVGIKLKRTTYFDTAFT